MTAYLWVYAKLFELHFNLLLFSNRREKNLKSSKKMGLIVDWFSGPTCRNWRTTIHWNVVMAILHKLWDIWSLWKIVGTTFQCIIVLHPREKVINSLKIWWTQDLKVQHIHLHIDQSFNLFICNMNYVEEIWGIF